MFYEQLELLCKENGTTPTAFVRDVLNLSTSKVTAWSNGSIPKIGILKEIASYFNVTVGYLFDGKKENSDSDHVLNIKEKANTDVSNWISNGYTNCYVAFLDILGYKEYTNKHEFEDIFGIFKIYDFMRNSIKDTYIGPAFNIGELSVLKFNCISDTIVISVPSSTKRSLEMLIFAVDMIIDNLIRNHNLFIRGSIVEGELYADRNNYLFGKALVEAYEYERNLALYPRIILMPKILEKFLNKKESSVENMKFLVSRDYIKNDDLYIVNYVKYILTNLAVERPKQISEKAGKQWIKFLNTVHSYLEECGIINIREKYLYFRDYYNFELRQLKTSGYAYFNSPIITDTIFGEYLNATSYSEAARRNQNNQNNIPPNITSLDNAPEQNY